MTKFTIRRFACTARLVLCTITWPVAWHSSDMQATYEEHGGDRALGSCSPALKLKEVDERPFRIDSTGANTAVAAILLLVRSPSPSINLKY